MTPPTTPTTAPRRQIQRPLSAPVVVPDGACPRLGPSSSRDHGPVGAPVQTGVVRRSSPRGDSGHRRSSGRRSLSCPAARWSDRRRRGCRSWESRRSRARPSLPGINPAAGDTRARADSRRLVRIAATAPAAAPRITAVRPRAHAPEATSSDAASTATPQQSTTHTTPRRTLTADDRRHRCGRGPAKAASTLTMRGDASVTFSDIGANQLARWAASSRSQRRRVLGGTPRRRAAAVTAS